MPRDEPAATPPSQSALPIAPTNAADDALWRAFAEGAGIDLTLPKGPPRELMKNIGKMMRIAVEGIHQLVTMRSTAKDEMRAEMTMIQVRGNNSLKFAPNAMVALQLLIQPPPRGFLPGPEALREAMIDLQSHQVGMTAGLRSALEAVLDRFEPAQVEAMLTTRSMFESLLPRHRKARLWELFLEHYRSLREEAQQDFHRLFGEAFRAAYEAQVRSLETAYEKNPPPAAPTDRRGSQ
jgi:FHA domain-containing protein